MPQRVWSELEMAKVYCDDDVPCEKKKDLLCRSFWGDGMVGGKGGKSLLRSSDPPQPDPPSSLFSPTPPYHRSQTLAGATGRPESQSLRQADLRVSFPRWFANHGTEFDQTVLAVHTEWSSSGTEFDQTVLAVHTEWSSSGTDKVKAAVITRGTTERGHLLESGCAKAVAVLSLMHI